MSSIDFESLVWFDNREHIWRFFDEIVRAAGKQFFRFDKSPRASVGTRSAWSTAFGAYVLSRIANRIAMQILVVVIGWEVYDIARETMSVPAAALRLGLIGLAQFLPLFCLSLPAGWLADHYSRTLIARVSAGVELACAVVLLAAIFYGWHEWETLFAVAAGLGVAQALNGPALAAYVSNIVPPPMMPRAIAIVSIAAQFGTIVGPALGGWARAASPTAPYVIACVLLTASLTSLGLFAPGKIAPPARASHDAGGIRDGLRYVMANKILLGAISLDLIAVLLGGATALLPLYARDVFHVGASGLGALRAMPSVGAAIMATYLSVRPIYRGVGPKLLTSVAVFGLATAAFGASRNLALALIFLVIVGGSDMISMYVRQSLMQIATPDAMRGRVGSVYTLFVSGSNELGEMQSGGVASLVGPVATVVGRGIAAVIVAIGWFFIFPDLRRASMLADAEGAAQSCAQWAGQST